MGSAPSELSMVSTTSARPSGARPEVPAKMTSSIFPPRKDLAPCSPITQLSASTTLDLPEPLGPTTQVMPGSKLRVVAEAKDLNPRKVKLLRYNVPPLDGVSSGDDPAAEGRPHCNRRRPKLLVRRRAGPLLLPGLATQTPAVSVTLFLPRTAEKVQNLFNRNDSGVTTAIVISCAQ